jgi:DNA/RNA-binding domain of Phe-tRNA-synthetase-like protein
MKTSEETIKGYDCVKSVRRIRAKINKELEGLSNEEIIQYFREASKRFQEKLKKFK